MALRFTVSAPGKVILSGEHSVVYGKLALAGVVGIRNTLTLEAVNRTQIVFNMDVANDIWTIELSDFNRFLHDVTDEFVGADRSFPASLDHESFLVKVQQFVHAHVSTSSLSSERFDKARYAVVYLLAAILQSQSCTELRHGFVVTFASGITMGAGLGSSAAYGVCLAAAFHFYASCRLMPNCIERFNAATLAERAEVKQTISDWAFCSERLMHGNPSGLDNTICTMGNLLRFRKGEKPEEVVVAAASTDGPLNVLLVNTKVDRSTATLVAQVASLQQKYPTLVQHLLDGMDTVVQDIVTILENGDANCDEAFPELGRLVRINNNLLRSIGVSHPSLEQIFAISERHGFASKLTGAGGGGYAIVMLPQGYETLVGYKKLCAELIECKFDVTATTIGGSGLEIREF